MSLGSMDVDSSTGVRYDMNGSFTDTETWGIVGVTIVVNPSGSYTWATESQLDAVAQQVIDVLTEAGMNINATKIPLPGASAVLTATP